MPDSRCLVAAAALGACLALLPLPSSAAGCDARSLDAVATAAAAPLVPLRAAVRGNTEMNPELEPAVADAIVVLKRRLASLVDAQVACLDAEGTAAALDTALAGSMRAVTSRRPLPAPSGSGAGETAVRFTSTMLHDGALLGVVTDFDIPCGSDAQWQLYARRGGRWHEVIRWAAPRYSRADGAWWAFQGLVSAPGRDGRWIAAATHVRPWCSSSWSVIDYAVIRPGARADAPQRLLAGHDDLWWGGEDFGRASLDAQTFELRFRGASIDPSVHNREFIRRYDLTATPPRRIAPVADAARDFVDEWLVSPWSQAQHWTAPSAALDLQRAHAQWQQRRRKGLLEFAPARRCSDSAVEVTVQSDADSVGYFAVDSDTEFRLYRVSDKPNPKCTEELAPP